MQFSLVVFSMIVSLLLVLTDYRVMMEFGVKLELTWLPNTPMLQADDTWSGPNHTAATRAGSDKMKTYSDCGWRRRKRKEEERKKTELSFFVCVFVFFFFFLVRNNGDGDGSDDAADWMNNNRQTLAHWRIHKRLKCDA